MLTINHTESGGTIIDGTAKVTAPPRSSRPTAGAGPGSSVLGTSPTPVTSHPSPASSTAPPPPSVPRTSTSQ
ncbi:hypothetical protein GS426_00410 [Rhodococcus hoagii]|nr:hypothetical protein [Prescottella equi]